MGSMQRSSGEQRKQEVPSYEIVCETLDYLRSLGLKDDDDDLYEFLKKFPGVLIGCGLEHELRNDVKILEKDRGIKGKLISTKTSSSKCRLKRRLFQA
ncbi:hypothetical protein NC652_041422 [Populus alba x Populus x berolinensis]|nr:hypothetical protein NC652_041422 [Populus alba x Populus x berolinensis]